MYDYSVKIRDKKVKFRKWKVKDKRKFISIIENASDTNLISEALVYDCLEKPEIPYSVEEINYILLHIRKESIGDNLDFIFKCNKCLNEYEHSIQISNIFVPKFKKFGILKYKDISFTMGEIQNKEYYLNTIDQCLDVKSQYLADFMLHVHKINDDDTFSFDTLYEYIEDMDIDISEEIFRQWNEMKFTFVSTEEIECPFCEQKTILEYNEMPGFFPESWFE